MVITLDQLIGIHQQLIEIAERKKSIIIEHKMNDLNELIHEEEELVAKLNQLNMERQELVKKGSKGNTSLSFSEYIKQIEDEFTRKKLQFQQATLYETMLELQEKNRLNEHLLKDAIQFTNYMMEQIMKSKQKQFNYQPPTHKQNASIGTRGFFDTKA